jgi:hypothetical protein
MIVWTSTTIRELQGTVVRQSRIAAEIPLRPASLPNGAAVSAPSFLSLVALELGSTGQCGAVTALMKPDDSTALAFTLSERRE